MMNAIHYAIMATLSMTLSKSMVKFLGHISVEQLIVYRMSFALIATFFIIKKKKISFRGAPKLILFLRGLFGTLGLFFLLSLIQRARFDSAIILHHITPIFSISFAYLLLKEKFSLKALSPLILVIIGIISLQENDVSLDKETLLIGLISSFFAALAYICIRHLKDKVSTYLIIFVFPLICLPITIPFAVQKWIWPELNDYIFIFFMGLSAWVGQIGLTKAYQLEKASKIAPINYLNIPFSILMAHFFFQEFISAKQILSISLILLGVFLTQYLQKNLSK